VRDLQLLLHVPRHEMGAPLGASVAGHVALLALAFLLFRLLTPADGERTVPHEFPALVWLADSGPGGGGGGGGDRSPEPARRAEIVPTQPPPVPAPAVEPIVEPEPLAPLPAQTPAATVTEPGALTAADASSNVQGPGRGDGGDSGAGTGIGPGGGDGVGPGGPHGIGGEAFQPGNGVLAPRLLRQVRPSYTADAMRARLQGLVKLECVVMPDGSVGRVRVMQSLDATFGLDQEAIKAARQWRFTPGTRFGQPVPVLVTIDLEFVLR
jgi:periplasmic protein TonB